MNRRQGSIATAATAAAATQKGAVRPNPPRAVDVLLDAVALRLTQGYAAAAPALSRGLERVRAGTAGIGLEAGSQLWLADAVGQMVALELWDAESSHSLAARQARFARDAGALVLLQFALMYLAVPHVLAGDLGTVARLIEEDQLIAEATRNPPLGYAEMILAAWRGREARAAELIDAGRHRAAARGEGRLAGLADYTESVLNNGLGRYDAALDAAR